MFSRAAQVSQLLDDLLELHSAETEMLAARADGLRNVFGRSRRQHENYVAGRFFQRFEQRVESRVGDLVGFVENVNLEAVARGTITRGLAQLANFINAAVGGGVDFDHVHGISGANFDAGIANAARLGDRLFRRAAIQRHGQNARDGGFADAAMSAENVAVSGASLLDGVFQGAGDVVLPDDFGEFLRTVFAGQDLVAHEEVQ